MDYKIGVHFLGERSDVLDLLADHQLMVVTSEREGFGYALLEALQAKLVVISTATGIASDLLPDNYLVESASAERVAFTIRRTLTDFARAKQDFVPVWSVAKDMTIRRMVNEVLVAYRETLTLRNRTKDKLR